MSRIIWNAVFARVEMESIAPPSEESLIKKKDINRDTGFNDLLEDLPEAEREELQGLLGPSHHTEDPSEFGGFDSPSPTLLTVQYNDPNVSSCPTGSMHHTNRI